jgi:hypothetical protein
VKQKKRENANRKGEGPAWMDIFARAIVSLFLSEPIIVERRSSTCK